LLLELPLPIPSLREAPVHSQVLGDLFGFIKRAKELGFTLQEIKDLLSLRATTGARCADVLARAEEKIRRIDGEVRRLQTMRRALVKLTSECNGPEAIAHCPVLTALDARTEKKDDDER